MDKEKSDVRKLTDALEATGYEVFEVKRHLVPVDTCLTTFVYNGLIDIKVKAPQPNVS